MRWYYYRRGFIHEEGAVRGQLRGERRSNVLEVDDPISHDDQAATSGQLTGLAADQTTMIAVDTEARSAQGNSRRNGGPRQLRDIVMESTEKWLMANDGADLEYYHEMKALGYVILLQLNRCDIVLLNENSILPKISKRRS